MKRLVCDVSNIFWRSVAAQKRYGPADAADSAGMGLHMCLMSLRKHYNLIRPDCVAVVFEGRQNWRKEHTRSERCYSQRLYKGNRTVDPGMEVLFEIMTAFEELARQHTSLVTLTHPKLEGDDLISGYAQHYSALGDEVVILSGDKDFVQLLGDPRVRLVNPDDGKDRTLYDVCGVADAGYFMFEKCMRGDAGDNVLPAYPRVRATRLHKAFGVKDGVVHQDLKDAFELSNLMNAKWEFVHPETGATRTMEVQRMFEENKLLMDLTAQPPEIRQLITEVIEHESQHHGTFNFFKFNVFLGKYRLEEVAKRASDFADLFSGRLSQSQPPRDQVNGLNL